MDNGMTAFFALGLILSCFSAGMYFGENGLRNELAKESACEYYIDANNNRAFRCPGPCEAKP